MDNDILNKRTGGKWRVDSSVEYETSVISKWCKENPVETSAVFGDYRGGIICTAHWNTGVPTKETAEANAAFIVTACNEYESLKKAAKLLEDLTPGGSEFYNDPQYCFDFIKKELRSIPSQILPFKKANDKLKEDNKLLLELVQEIMSYKRDLDSIFHASTEIKIRETLKKFDL